MSICGRITYTVTWYWVLLNYKLKLSLLAFIGFYQSILFVYRYRLLFHRLNLKFSGYKLTMGEEGALRPLLRGGVVEEGGRPWPDQTVGEVCVLVL